MRYVESQAVEGGGVSLRVALVGLGGCADTRTVARGNYGNVAQLLRYDAANLKPLVSGRTCWNELEGQARRFVSDRRAAPWKVFDKVLRL